MPPRVDLESSPWEIIECPYQPQHNIYFETNFTLGNGYMGARGCLEEGFPEPLERYEGTYIAGVFDNFEGDYVELVNVPDLFAVQAWVGESPLNLQTGETRDYRRVLDMRTGVLTRSFTWVSPQGGSTRFTFQRFFSLARPHLACLRLCVTRLDHALPIRVSARLDGEVFNRRQRDYPPIQGIIPNYHLDVLACGANEGDACLSLRTKGTGISMAQHAHIAATTAASSRVDGASVVQEITLPPESAEVVIDRFVTVFTSREALAEELAGLAAAQAAGAAQCGYDALLAEQAHAWAARWEEADIVIDGDPRTQQGIRFNIFHLIQANARSDAHVSLAAKLLSHTRYKGNAFWDTELFMFPFFLFTDPEAARNLLKYRYHMLPGARTKAQRLGMHGAMYPWMSANDGSEQCDSWEYGDCEIHITADIAFAIDQYLRVSADDDFFRDCAAEILIETARFWAERVNWNPRRKCYTIITVKGPDEYCAITNNNMFTNYMAAYNLELAEKAVARLQAEFPKNWAALQQRLGLQAAEIEHWSDIRQHMYQNWDHRRDLLIQDDTFLDQPEFDLAPFKERETPVLEIIGYERAMRVRILRQTDALLLMYLLNDRFTQRQKLACFNYYEPMTTHDSSLSYNTHCIMAAELGLQDKACYYLEKTCRLDLDDELNTARSGLHGASLGGTWQSIVNGFGGVRVHGDTLSFQPMLPSHWHRLSFRLRFRGRAIAVTLTGAGLDLQLLEGDNLTVLVDGQERLLRRTVGVFT